ncbi:phage repressor protein, partial [Bilophila wadsworthia]|nr:phage repressor protein [Bilophila wadsworthia]
ITYYSDNAAENPPEVYSLMEDFDGDWNKSIVGRVVWAWSDVSCK